MSDSDYILVVDDEPDIRELFNIMLTMAGFEIQTASDGREAMQAISESIPALILLDLMMPYVDGFEVVDKLRGNEDLLGIRVLVVTAKSLNDGDRKKLAGWPVVGTLNKGELDLTHMVRLVKNALAHRPPTSDGEGPGLSPKDDDGKGEPGPPPEDDDGEKEPSPPPEDGDNDTPSGRSPDDGERSVSRGDGPGPHITLK